MLRSLFALVLCALGGPALRADDAPVASTEQALTPLIRQLLLQSMPQPLGASPGNWGQQRDVLVGVKWHRLKPEPMKSPRNDGHWQRVRVESIEPAETFGFGLANLHSPEPQRTTFEATLGLNVRVVHEQQLWKSGVRLYSGETRARAYVAVKVNCEMTTRFEQPAGHLLPTAVVRLRVTEADLHYKDLVCEHIVGLDGQPAKVVGDMVLKSLRQVKPGWDAGAKDRANAAIVRAADTREVRLELGKLFPGRASILAP